MKLSVIIITLNRPDCMKRCLDCLEAQDPRPDEVIVVDGSRDERTQKVLDAYPYVLRLRNEKGYGHMTHSRNRGLAISTGDIIAFLDDDSFAYPGWSANLLQTYRDHPEAGAVGGKALNGLPHEETTGLDQIGRLTHKGDLTGFFAADPGKTLEVDHIIGCNMSFRRDVLAKLGGLREDYPGTEVREESDICIRVRKLGYRILFNPKAAVLHIGAPQSKGKRFDTRYAYYASRNHAVLLVRNFGLTGGITLKYLSSAALRIPGEFVRRIVAAFARVSAETSGTIIGLCSGLMIKARTGMSPERRDAYGQELEAKLGGKARVESQTTGGPPPATIGKVEPVGAGR